MSEAAFQRPQRPPRYDTPTPRQVIGNPGISDRIRSEQVIGFDRNPHAKVIIAPTRGSNTFSNSKVLLQVLVIIAPTRGSNSFTRSRPARTRTVIIAPTRGSNMVSVPQAM